MSVRTTLRSHWPGAFSDRTPSSGSPPMVPPTWPAPWNVRADLSYISAGPVEPTPTKPGRPGTGLEYLTQATAATAATAAAAATGRAGAERERGRERERSRAAMPVFVTGGVTPEKIPLLAGAGARHFVVVRYLTEAADPTRAARALRDAIDAIEAIDAVR